MILICLLQVATILKSRVVRTDFSRSCKDNDKDEEGKGSVESPSKRSSAAGARNFNIRRGSSELAITTQARGGRDKPPGKPSRYGRQHMLSLSLIKFLQCCVPTRTSSPTECNYCCVITLPGDRNFARSTTSSCRFAQHDVCPRVWDTSRRRIMI